MNPSPAYLAASHSAVLFDLSDRGKIEIAGPDARSFLHNLCTQDVIDLPVGATREAFLTTIKARVIAHIWITHREQNVLWLDMATERAPVVLKHLDHHLISEKVELTDRTQEQSFWRLVGPDAESLLQKLAITPFRRHRLLALDGYDLLGPANESAEFGPRLVAAGAVLGTADTYQTMRIETGLPEYGIDIDENRLAMEVNRNAQAISYTKGCYLGQETIVMARDRGQVNRLLMGVKVGQGEPLVPGAKLFRGDEEVGQVTSSTFSPRLGQVIALAYLRRGAWDAGTELSIDSRTAVVCNLPFEAQG